MEPRKKEKEFSRTHMRSPFLLRLWHLDDEYVQNKTLIEYLQGFIEECSLPTHEMNPSSTFPNLFFLIHKIMKAIRISSNDFCYPSLIIPINFAQIHSSSLAKIAALYAHKRLNNLSTLSSWYQRSLTIVLDGMLQLRVLKDYQIKSREKENGDIEAVILWKNSLNIQSIFDILEQTLKECYIDEDDKTIQIRKTCCFLEIEINGAILTWREIKNFDKLPSQLFATLEESSLRSRLLTDCFLFYVEQNQQLSSRASLPFDIYPFLVSKFLQQPENNPIKCPLSNETQEIILLQRFFECYSSEDFLIEAIHAYLKRLENIRTSHQDSIIDDEELVSHCEQLLNLMKNCCSLFTKSNPMEPDRLL